MAQSSYERQIPYQQQVLQMPEPVNTLTNIGNMSHKPKQSRLELMKQNYEKKRQKDVEDSLAEMRAQEARAGSGKTSGTVRSFFAERRAMEANVKDHYALPPIDRHFKKVKDSRNSAPPRQTRNGHQQYIPPSRNNQSSSAGKKHLPPQYHRKRSKGVDKQNPLPPLQRGLNSNYKPPTPNKRYETHQTLTTDNTMDESIQQYQQQHQQQTHVQQQKQVQQQQLVHVPQPPQQPNPLRTTRPMVESRSDFDETSSTHSDEPPPNLSKLKALRQKRLSKQMSLVKQDSVDKPTDFQKWQMDQDRERAERLEKHKQKSSQQESKAEVTLSFREKELLEKIQAEQEKLKEIKRLQQELEEQEIMEDDDQSSTYDLTLADKIDRPETVNDEIKPEKIQQTHKPVQQLKPDAYKEDNKSQGYIQPKKEKVTKVAKKPQLPLDETDSDENRPKENFTAFYEQAAANNETVELDLSPCSICGRNFATERLARHEKICNKNSKKTRKAFDVQKQRVSGMEHEKYVASGVYKKERQKVSIVHLVLYAYAC